VREYLHIKSIQQYTLARAGKMTGHEPRDLVADGMAAFNEANALATFRNPYRSGKVQKEKEPVDIPHTDNVSIDEMESDLEDDDAGHAADNPAEFMLDDFDDEELPDIMDLLASVEDRLGDGGN
jgi:hypothetical protein